MRVARDSGDMTDKTGAHKLEGKTNTGGTDGEGDARKV